MEPSGTTALERSIRSQPEALRRVVRTQIESVAELLASCRRLWLVGTGTSQHAAELGAAMFHEAGRAATAVPSMNFVSWAPMVGPSDGIVIITHTAESSFALSARAQAIAAGLNVVSITGQGAGLPEAIETVPMEGSQTYTVSYTTSLLVLARLAEALGAASLSLPALASIPDAVQRAIDEPGIRDIPTPARLMVLSGVGPASITAREGALKLREGSKLLAEGYDVEYLLHGAAVPLTPEDGLVLLTPPEDTVGLLRAVGRAAEQEGIAVSWIEERSDLPRLLAQIPLTVRLQLLALRFALERGKDPDEVITGAWANPELWSLGAP